MLTFSKNANPAADFTQLAQTFALANTPLYLVRKFREDPTVQELARGFSGEQILAVLEKALNQEPVSLLDYTKPYAYLVALSLMPEGGHLREAAKLPNMDKWQWLSYIRAVLAETFIPTTRFHVEWKPSLSELDSPIRSATPTERQFVKPVDPESWIVDDQHHLKNKDLVGIFATENVVSEILSGKSKLTVEHIKRLSERFSISPAVFFP